MEAQRTLIFIVAATLVLLSSCLANSTVRAGAANVGQVIIDGRSQQDFVRGSGRLGTTARTLAAFERVVVGVPASVRVVMGPDSSISLQGDDNLLDLLTTRVDGDVLYLAAERSFAPQLPLTIVLTTPALTGLEQRASGDVKLENVRSRHLELRLAGAGRMQGSGEVENLDVELAGSGEMRMETLRSGQAVVRIGGAGNVHVYAERALRAVITGAGSIRYGGNPRIEQEIRGAGSIMAEST